MDSLARFGYMMIGVLMSLAVFAGVRAFSRPHPQQEMYREALSRSNGEVTFVISHGRHPDKVKDADGDWKWDWQGTSVGTKNEAKEQRDGYYLTFKDPNHAAIVQRRVKEEIERALLDLPALPHDLIRRRVASKTPPYQQLVNDVAVMRESADVPLFAALLQDLERPQVNRDPHLRAFYAGVVCALNIVKAEADKHENPAT